jgi:hypothetical protein
MQFRMTELIVAGVLLLSALPATAQIDTRLRAYLDANGNVQLLPGQRVGAASRMQVLNNGNYVTGGGSLALPSGTSLTLPTSLTPGMTLNSSGTVLTGPPGQLRRGLNGINGGINGNINGNLNGNGNGNGNGNMNGNGTFTTPQGQVKIHSNGMTTPQGQVKTH